jgi:hypothetical protein
LTAIRFTIVDDGRATAVDASRLHDTVTLDAAAVHAALGWELTGDGLCREGVCVPMPPQWAADGGVDLSSLAGVLARPLALDLEERVAWLGVAAEERARALRALSAPDFALPDVDGRVHRLSDHRGKKVLLVVWASW